MTRSELIAELAAANPHLRLEDMGNVVDAILDGIADALTRGDRVELRGFGSFSARLRAARIGRNPRTGGAVAVAAKRAVYFAAGKELRQRVDRDKPSARTRPEREVRSESGDSMT